MVAVTIEVNPRMIERFVYWIIILILGVLLIMSYLKDDTTPTDDTGSVNTDTVTPPPPTTTTPPPVATASCDDGKKNQDETDVDCGGACGTCASGKACLVAADCSGGYCTANKCTSQAPPVLGGKIDFQLTDVAYQRSATGSTKVTGISYKITNGLSTDYSQFLLRVYVKNKASTRCLNQQTTGTCDDSYAEFTVKGAASGKTVTDSHTFDDGEYTTLMGRFLIEDTGYDYTDATKDDFTVQVYLYDTEGEEIDGKSVTGFMTKNPA